MELSKQAIKEFQRIYQQTYGGKITPNKAQQLGLNLITLIYLIYQQIPNKKN